jgi:hypothetical protein
LISWNPLPHTDEKMAGAILAGRRWVRVGDGALERISLGEAGRLTDLRFRLLK